MRPINYIITILLAINLLLNYIIIMLAINLSLNYTIVLLVEARRFQNLSPFLRSPFDRLLLFFYI
jgi:hypothetical protein